MAIGPTPAALAPLRLPLSVPEHALQQAVGAAFGNVRTNLSNDPVTSSIEAGWTVGAGVEVAFARNWSAKAEYLFVNLADGSCTTNCAIADASGTPIVPNVAVKFNESIVRGGINYRFSL